MSITVVTSLSDGPQDLTPSVHTLVQFPPTCVRVGLCDQ